jgi:alkylhydroperoxidase family enzyme
MVMGGSGLPPFVEEGPAAVAWCEQVVRLIDATVNMAEIRELKSYVFHVTVIVAYTCTHNRMMTPMGRA